MRASQDSNLPHLLPGLGDARALCLFNIPTAYQREDSSLEPEPQLTAYPTCLDELSQFTALNEELAEPLLARGRNTGYGAAHTNPSLPDLLGPEADPAGAMGSWMGSPEAFQTAVVPEFSTKTLKGPSHTPWAT